MIELARKYGSYGYRRVAVLLREAGWQVSGGRIEAVTTGGAEGASETTQERQALAERWIMYPVETRASQPCLAV